MVCLKGIRIIERWFVVSEIDVSCRNVGGKQALPTSGLGRLRAMFCLLGTALLLAGCQLQGVKLTNSGDTREPHMDWNGTEFAIAYYDRSKPGSALGIRILKVDENGNITGGPKTLATLSGGI